MRLHTIDAHGQFLNKTGRGFSRMDADLNWPRIYTDFHG
jgi:hypothetical protein